MLLDGLDEAFDRKSWHGPNLRGSLRGVTVAQAAWRPPGPGARHNIWELALHAAYWKYVVRRRLTGLQRGAFPLSGSNFFTRPADAAPPSDAAWKADIAILETEHRELRAAVAALGGGGAATLPPKTVHLIRGAAAHDLYHAGQIRLLRRMQQ